MAKFHGIVAYVHSEETTLGVWTDVVSEREYYGDVLREAKQWTKGDKVNDDLILSNRISIIADDFAYQNFSAMRYVKYGGVSWRITNVEIQRPRLILTLGGVYNGKSA